MNKGYVAASVVLFALSLASAAAAVAAALGGKSMLSVRFIGEVAFHAATALLAAILLYAAHPQKADDPKEAQS